MVLLFTVKIEDIDLKRSCLWVRRLKNGLSVEHPIPGDELRAIKLYQKERDSRLPWLFLSERGQPMTRQSVNCMITTVGERARLLGVHPHAAPFMRLLFGRPRLRSSVDPGLSGPPRPETHCPLHPGGGAAVQRTLARILSTKMAAGDSFPITGPLSRFCPSFCGPNSALAPQEIASSRSRRSLLEP